MNHENKILQLGGKMVGPRAQDPEKEIQTIEQELEVRLPEEYRTFILHYASAISFGKDAVYRPLELSPFADDAGRQDLGMFYGPVRGEFGLQLNNARFRSQIPPHVLAIGDECFGDQICLAIMGPTRGQIYYWYHEDLDELRVYHIARSFDEFVEMLEPDL